MSVLIVGSIALDDVKTPVAEHCGLLGGSASYAAVSAANFGPVSLVGIVGDDFPQEHIELFGSRNIDLAGLQKVTGKTFHWSGEYLEDMNMRETRSVELNVFEHFSPDLPESCKDAPYILLGNISPDLQIHVLDQARKPKFVIADTMDLWITIAKPKLIELLGRIDMLILNDGEARMLTGESNLVTAARAIRAMGPAYVAIKKGEHGCLLFSETEVFSCPAYPLESILDPTGAGDTFAGGVAGYLAARNEAVDFEALRRAVVYGSVLASYNVEAFSLERLKTVGLPEVEGRYGTFRKLAAF